MTYLIQLTKHFNLSLSIQLDQIRYNKEYSVGGGFSRSCPYCIGVDLRNNKIYVANGYSDTVSVIDGNSDTVKKTIRVGSNPTRYDHITDTRSALADLP
jgi:YVTN family beta-propeller protein